MNKRTRKGQKLQSRPQDLTVVETVNTMEEAKDCEELLKSNGIAATIKQHRDEFTNRQHYAVMVREDVADEAHVVIECQGGYDDLYDFSTDDDDDDEEEFEDDAFNDEP